MVMVDQLPVLWGHQIQLPEIYFYAVPLKTKYRKYSHYTGTVMGTYWKCLSKYQHKYFTKMWRIFQKRSWRTPFWILKTLFCCTISKNVYLKFISINFFKNWNRFKKMSYKNCSFLYEDKDCTKMYKKWGPI